MVDFDKSGGRAFPGTMYGHRSSISHAGMTLRDWFAGQALLGLLSDHETDGEPEVFATQAYALADAMVAVRQEGE